MFRAAPRQPMKRFGIISTGVLSSFSYLIMRRILILSMIFLTFTESSVLFWSFSSGISGSSSWEFMEFDLYNELIQGCGRPDDRQPQADADADIGGVRKHAGYDVRTARWNLR